MVILFAMTYLVILQPRVNASEEILEIQQEILTIQDEIDRFNESISGHQFQYKNAVKEMNYCIAQCQFSWNNEANKEHLAADSDRVELQKLEWRLDSLNKRLGLLMERQLQ